MNTSELRDKTAKRIGNLSSVELEFSMDQLKDYPSHERGLLAAIKTQDDYYYIGLTLMTYLRVVNSEDISLHGGEL